MNVVDICILGILALSVLFGLYKGFISSVLSTGGCLVAFGLAFYLYPKLAGLIQGNPALQRTLLNYTDASSRIGDLATSVMNVAQLTRDKIVEVVSRANLPQPLSDILQSNLENRVYTGISTVSDYVSETVLTACINILCFIACFALVYIALNLVFGLVRAIFKLPVLKQLNALAGGAFGLLRGVVILYVLFTLVPIVETVVPVKVVSDVIAQSTLAPLFNNGSLITAIMNGHL